MHEAGHPKPVLWDNPVGLGGREVGGRFKKRQNMYTCSRFMLRNGKKKKITIL